ncbi:hypothetical protein GZH49_37680 [Nocardia terpenica]|uniref:hypothetical protein n=1 Tax=Nocardia terpenica TaxID=455432 RepID=UPI002FDF668B
MVPASHPVPGPNAVQDLGSQLAELFPDGSGSIIARAMDTAFSQHEWMEDEIAIAQAARPRLADRLWHAGTLCGPTFAQMSTEFVYRAHARELLHRVADRADTRPATAPEVALAALQVSVHVPLNTPAMGLYLRMWHTAGFPRLDHIDADGYEAIAASQIDDLERFARSKLSVADRVLGVIVCGGRHNGIEVDCAFATSSRRLAA